LLPHPKTEIEGFIAAEPFFLNNKPCEQPMKTIVSVSDTHNHCIAVPHGNILIHAGDATENGQEAEFESLNRWFGSMRHAAKIYIPGNHDHLFHLDRSRAQSIVKNAICLIDEFLEIDGLKIYGSPWVPLFEKWAFMLDEEDLKQKWAQIPEGLDILITHGPVFGIRDLCCGSHYGSTSLRDRLQEMKAPPKLHLFGHIHDAYGSVKVGDTTHHNLAICNGKKEAVNAPTVLEY
jgi:Icc-related predicted phosphoesterase